MPFYHIQSNTSTPCHLTCEADAEALQTWLCPGCLSPKPGITSVDVHIQASPTKKPLNFVFGAGVPILSTKLLSALDPILVKTDLFIGSVFGPTGEKLDDWRTFRGRQRLLIRGTEDANYRICEECGRVLYFSMGKPFLFPNPRAEINIFESHVRGIVMTERAFLRSELKEFPGIHVSKIFVANEPIDGFGDLLTH